MQAQLIGLLIRRERCRRHWSQQGLCKGVCSVSYLSKIERGRADADYTVLMLLMEKLGLAWRDDPDTQKEVAAELDAAYDAVLDLRERDARTEWRRVEADFERVMAGPYLIDGLALRSYFTGEKDSILDDPALLLSPRQMLVICAWDGRQAELPARVPCAFACLVAGEAAYQGGNYALAVEQLGRAYDLAAAEGRAYIMLQAALLLGNSASNRMEYDRMTAHYRMAERLAQALGKRGHLRPFDTTLPRPRWSWEERSRPTVIFPRWSSRRGCSCTSWPSAWSGWDKPGKRLPPWNGPNRLWRRSCRTR